MALTADQQAMLQLLLERGQSYADLAELLGVSEDEVRTRARAALTELAGTDPDANVGLTDWLLGQADPIGRADAVRHLKEDPADHNLAGELEAKLQLIAPKAELPRLPGEPRGGGGFLRRPAPAETPEKPAKPPRQPRTQLSSKQTRLIAVLAIAGVVLLFVILAVAGAFSGSGDSGSSTQASDTSSTTGGQTTSTTASGADACQGGNAQPIARVPLQPVDNGDAAGLANVEVINGDTACLTLQLRNLEPPPSGQSYIVWFLFTDTKGYPLAPLTGIKADGSYDNSIQIPPATISLVARAQAIEVSLAANQDVAAAIQKASKSQQIVIDVPGQAIARGTVPVSAKANAGSGG
jgi:hypothetical protein